MPCCGINLQPREKLRIPRRGLRPRRRGGDSNAGSCAALYARSRSVPTEFTRTCETVNVRGLAQSRREVGQGEVGGVNFFREFAVHLGFVAYTFPLGVVLERFPVGGSRFPARVLKNVDQAVALLRLIEGRPISNVFHAGAFKQLHGVVAEAGQQFSEFSGSCMVNAEFVD